MVTGAHWAAGKIFIAISVNTRTQWWVLLATPLVSSHGPCAGCNGKEAASRVPVPLLRRSGKTPRPARGIETNPIIVRNVLLTNTHRRSSSSEIVANKYFLDSWDSI